MAHRDLALCEPLTDNNECLGWHGFVALYPIVNYCYYYFWAALATAAVSGALVSVVIQCRN